MNKKELVNAIAETPGITGAQAEKIIQSFMASITTALSKGEKVTLMGLGSLQTVKTKTRMYRDINSGESKKARGKTIVKFRTGSHLSEKIKSQGCLNYSQVRNQGCFTIRSETNYSNTKWQEK
jgi:DNA-binding protein HU-beta